MTIASELSRAAYLTDGATTAFAVPFRFLHASHLRVIHVQGGAQTALDASAYTVSGAGAASGGTVTIAPPLAANGQLVILRQVPLTQETHYPKNDPFPEHAHETALDKLTMIAQQHHETLQRTVALPVSWQGTSAEFIDDLFDAAHTATEAANAASASQADTAASEAAAAASATASAAAASAAAASAAIAQDPAGLFSAVLAQFATAHIQTMQRQIVFECRLPLQS